MWEHRAFQGLFPPKILPTTVRPPFAIRDRLLGALRESGGSARVLGGLAHPSDAGEALGSRSFEGGMQEGMGWVWRGTSQSCSVAQKRARKHKYLGGSVNPAASPRGRRDPRAELGAVCSP